MKNRTISKTVLCLLMGCSLSACGTADRLSRIGKAPDMAPIENPQTAKNYRPVSMPMPAPQVASRQPNSLWQSNRKSFFKDQRAGTVGDILTVTIDIKDTAEVKNKTTRQRDGSEAVAAPHVLGFERQLQKILPVASDVSNLAQVDSSSSTTGDGQIKRNETVSLKLAAVINQVLPNGTLVINGKQEVLVNYEKRILSINGIIRPEDISTDNSVPYEKIAEARIVYGGEGQVTDIQQARYGQQLIDVLSPF
jgi:flagellar L-ring protein precursor FlgH